MSECACVCAHRPSSEPQPGRGCDDSISRSIPSPQPSAGGSEGSNCHDSLASTDCATLAAREVNVDAALAANNTDGLGIQRSMMRYTSTDGYKEERRSCCRHNRCLDRGEARAISNPGRCSHRNRIIRTSSKIGREKEIDRVAMHSVCMHACAGSSLCLREWERRRHETRLATMPSGGRFCQALRACSMNWAQMHPVHGSGRQAACGGRGGRGRSQARPSQVTAERVRSEVCSCLQLHFTSCRPPPLLLPK